MTRLVRGSLLIALLGAAVLAPPAAAHDGGGVKRIDHFVVIYEENHSFDNLYGGWEQVDGLRDADRGAHAPGQPGRRAVRVPAPERRQPDLAAAVGAAARTPRRRSRATSSTSRSGSTTTSRPRTRRARRPGVFAPNGVLKGYRREPGGCTRDLVHRFYQEQYQLDGGRQDRYVTGSDAVGLTMGHYDTKQLPVYEYLHEPQGARLRDLRPLLPGGVRRLVPQPPVAGRRGDADVHGALDDGSADDLHSLVDSNGMPNDATRSTRRPARSRTRR